MNLDIDTIRTACLETSLRMQYTLKDISKGKDSTAKIDTKWEERFIEDVNRAFTETCAAFFMSDISFSLTSRQVVVENLLANFPLHTHFIKNVRNIGSVYLHREIQPYEHSDCINPQKSLFILVGLDTKDDMDLKAFTTVVQTVGEQVLNNTPVWKQWIQTQHINSTTGDFRNFVIAAMQTQPESLLPMEFRTAAFHQSLLKEINRAPIAQQSDIDNLINRMKGQFNLYSASDKNAIIQKSFDEKIYLLHLTSAFQVFFATCRAELEKQDAYFTNTLKRINTTAP